MSDIIKTPWSKELVDTLNKYQKCGAVHPYTCGDCRDKMKRFATDGDIWIYLDNGKYITAYQLSDLIPYYPERK